MTGVRPARREDLPAWLRLRAALWPEAGAAQHELEAEAALARTGRSAVFLAIGPGGEPCGFLEAELRDHAEGLHDAPGGLRGGVVRRPRLEAPGVRPGPARRGRELGPRARRRTLWRPTA